MNHRISRRRFGRIARTATVTLGLGGVSAYLAACGKNDDSKAQPTGLSGGVYNNLDPRRPEAFTRPLRLPGAEGALGLLDVPSTPLDVVARRTSQALLPDKAADVLTYEVQSGGKTYLNPILRVPRGTEFAPRLVNQLDEATIIHWHGLHVDWRNDGHPSYAAAAGAAYDYRFTVSNRAGMYWYHPHPHGATARQAYRGLAGLLLVDDQDDQQLRERLDLTLGTTDIPLVVQDRLFNDNGSLLYPANAAEQVNGIVGDVVLLNGVPNPTLDVASRLYRFRLLNGSNARVLRLALEKGTERQQITVIGTDGGLLVQPKPVAEVFLGPAERVDFLVDLRAGKVGDTFFLKSVTFDPMHNEGSMANMGGQSGGGMSNMPGMGGGSSTSAAEPRLPDGAGFNLLKLAVTSAAGYDRTVPAQLASITPITAAAATKRPIALSFSGNKWLINNVQFDGANMEKELFRSRSNMVEAWDITNDTKSMPHPMHLHGFQFQVLERRGSPEQVKGQGIDANGRVATDLGWKDTVLVWPGETVQIGIDFTNTFTGEQLYTFHCHNLEHEDQGMMVNYRVG